MRNYLILAAILATAGLSTTANATTVFPLNLISRIDIGSSTQGTVTLAPNASDAAHQIDVIVALAAGDASNGCTSACQVLLVNTGGGPHTPFVFNLASTVAGATVTVTSVNTPATFFVDTGGQSETPYGTFTNAIGYNGGNGGVGHGSAGPLTFSVYYAGGISISDFVANAGGYYFAADLFGTKGGTGGVASNTFTSSVNPPATVPVPATLPLFMAGLGLLGLFGLRRKTRMAALAA